ncbi:hypothetical protein GCM10011391_11540 [Pullulanibacillus camelliae]|uniref:Bile acid:sodium symporter family protein n=1 Tax=Pullulanibacillus camelliae TaxID=1707096 RepID=A0A8J2VNF5_9BACL|nr:bile acid:sodium symporter family protein [Pullulanibacillus camelliae]GGE34554.1 hypothetical protein GCM10011391_11540 [Pullulanibacillus camelliae]
MLQSINKQLEKWMPLITPTGVVVGVIGASYLKEFSFLIPWIFAFMTFTGSLSSNFKSLKEAVMHPFPVFITLFILHILMPLWTWGVGHTVFSGDAYTLTGLILGMVIPTGITSFIWVSMYKGHATLTLSIILIDTLLSPLIVPYSLHWLIGETVKINSVSLMLGLLQMIVIPSLIAMTCNHLTHGKVKRVLSPRLGPFSKLGLGLVVMLNGAVVAPYLKHFSLKLLSIAGIVFILAFSGYLFAFIIGRLLRRSQSSVIAITYTGGMRNISAGAVLAVSYFPAPVVIGMLFQQVLASLYGVFLNKFYAIKTSENRQVS